MRLIDADRLKEVFHRNVASGDAFDQLIDIQPTIEQRPKGKWIIVDDCEMLSFIAKCSVCGKIEDSRLIKDYPFCHCGADMREVEDA